jgi:hypothetical protein
MNWSMIIFVICAVALLCALSMFLGSTLAAIDGRKFPLHKLGVAGFALVIIGSAVLQERPNVYPLPPGFALVDNLGGLVLISGLAFLFILFCVSRTALSRGSGENGNAPKNPIREFLK